MYISPKSQQLGIRVPFLEIVDLMLQSYVNETEVRMLEMSKSFSESSSGKGGMENHYDIVI